MTLHTLGTTASASVFGAALGAVGGVLGAPWGRWGFWLAAAIAAIYASRELTGLRVPLPAARKQVPEWWRTFFSLPVASLLYGVGLGIGFFTHVSFGTLVAVSAAAIASGKPLVGLALVGPFGLARGLSVLVVAGGVTGGAVDRVMARLDRLAMSSIPRRVNGVALAAVAGALAAAGSTLAGPGLRRLAVVVLATAFAWAAAAKMAGFRRWRATLAGFALGPLRGVAAVGVPVAEAMVPLLALSGHPPEAGVLAGVELLAFSAAVLRARRLRGDRLPCGCFGGSKVRDYRLMLARNAALLALAISVTVGPVAGPVLRVGRPGTAAFLPAPSWPWRDSAWLHWCW